MTIKVSRRGKIPPFIVMDVLRAANQRQAEGKDVLHLELGQPATRAPARVIEAAHEMLETIRARSVGRHEQRLAPPIFVR